MQKRSEIIQSFIHAHDLEQYMIKDIWRSAFVDKFCFGVGWLIVWKKKKKNLYPQKII